MRKVFLPLIGLVVLAGCTSVAPQSSPTPNPSITGNRNIQLDTFPTPPPTYAPPPSGGNQCQLEGAVNNCSCLDIPQPDGSILHREICSLTQSCLFKDICQTCTPNALGLCYDPRIASNGQGYVNCPALAQALQNGQELCIGKPVIYLYPIQPTVVSVLLHIPSEIYISDPYYPTFGWQNVLAQPTGELTYQGKSYPYLYYETAVKEIAAPTQGVVVAKTDVHIFLVFMLDRLGLTAQEQADFFAYWTPKLDKLPEPYLQVSLIDHIEKERIDGVTISPKPDTFIGFLVYFKPHATRVDLPPMSLPALRPARRGFTAVEWGGTIAR